MSFKAGRFSKKANITGIPRDSYIYIIAANYSTPGKGGCGRLRKMERILELVQTITEEALERGEEVRLSGFGIFRITDRAARTAYNPNNREPVQVPRRKGIVFKPSSRLAKKVKASGYVPD